MSETLASSVVFLVALPLCMGIAIASGAPATAGLITGIVGGLVVAPLAGCPLQVSGPAAGLAVLVWDLIQRHGLEALGPLVMTAGLFQLLSGLLGMGIWFLAVPPAVIHAMLAGIGVLIFGSQFHVMVDDVPKSSGLMNLLSIPEAIYKGILPVEGTSHHLAAFLGILTIGTILSWAQLAPARFKALPPPLVGVTLSSIIASIFGFDVKYVDVPSDFLGSLTVTEASAWSVLSEPGMLLTALAIALIASAETMLTAGAVDQLQAGSRTNQDRELRAQGIGNLICGLLGGLPMTGVIVRSKANIDAGAKTRLSAFLHGAWMLGFLCLWPEVLGYIPVASLAAILVYTGWKLVDTARMRDLAKVGRSLIFIYACTLVGIVGLDLLKGIGIGLTLSALRLLYVFSHLGVWITKHLDEGKAIMHLRGRATFLLLPRIETCLIKAPETLSLEIDITELDYIDHACIEYLEGWNRRRVLVVDWDALHGLQYKLLDERSQRPQSLEGIDASQILARNVGWAAAPRARNSGRYNRLSA